jgi:hypothetical protein
MAVFIEEKSPKSQVVGTGVSCYGELMGSMPWPAIARCDAVAQHRSTSCRSLPHKPHVVPTFIKLVRTIVADFGQGFGKVVG